MKKIFFAALGAFLSLGSYGGDWPLWRGPDRNGIAIGEKINPGAFKSAPDILWKVELGAGYSAVSVKDGKVYSMGNKDNNDIIYCLDEKTGKSIWEYSYPVKSGGGYAGPRSTPIIEDDLVFAFSQTGEISCVDAKTGKLVWNKNVGKMEAKNLTWGFASSACPVDKMVVINAGESGMAFDQKTGKDLWKNNGGTGNYSTPVFFSSGKKEYLAVFGKKELFVVDKKNGARQASLEWETKYDVNAADPLVLDDGESIFISSGYNRGCALLSFKKGRLEKIWENKNLSSHFTSPVSIGDYIYGVNGNAGGGDLVCIQKSNGNQKWKGSTGFGSFTVADGKIIYLNEGGALIIAEASPDSYKELARTSTGLGKTCWTMPVLANGRLYCRNDKGTLLCINAK